MNHNVCVLNQVRNKGTVKDVPLNKFVATAAQTQKANSLRDKLKNGTSRLKGGNSTAGVANDSIDWDNLDN